MVRKMQGPEERSDARGIGELRKRSSFPPFARPKGNQKMSDFFGFSRRRYATVLPPLKSCELISFFWLLNLTRVRILLPNTYPQLWLWIFVLRYYKI
jgi:hypothetical protein